MVKLSTSDPATDRLDVIAKQGVGHALNGQRVAEHEDNLQLRPRAYPIEALREEQCRRHGADVHEQVRQSIEKKSPEAARHPDEVEVRGNPPEAEQPEDRSHHD